MSGERGTRPRSIVDLLARLPKEQLIRMRATNRAELTLVQAEVARLAVEEHQLSAASRPKRVGLIRFGHGPKIESA